MQYNEWWMMSSKIKLINSFKPTHTVPQCHSSTPITILLHSTIYIYNSAPCRLSSHIHTVTPPINNSTPSIQNATPHLNTATPCIYTVTSPIHPMPHVPSITLPQLPFTLHISHSSHALYHNYNPHFHIYNYTLNTSMHCCAPTPSLLLILILLCLIFAKSSPLANLVYPNIFNSW